MKICVCGWYMNDYFYEALAESGFDSVCISHKDDVEVPRKFKIKTFRRPNIGLEWGAYDYYVREIWDGESNVLFTHDDTKILRPRVLKEISWLDYDQCYIFKNRREEKNNGGKHGRAVFMSARFIRLLMSNRCDCELSKDREDTHHNHGAVLPGTGDHRGFWYDPFNHGHSAGKPPMGVCHYNTAIYHFHWVCGRVRDGKVGDKTYRVVGREFFPDYDCARRGVYRVER